MIVKNRITETSNYFNAEYVLTFSDEVELGGPCPLATAFSISQGGLGEITGYQHFCYIQNSVYITFVIFCSFLYFQNFLSINLNIYSHLSFCKKYIILSGYSRIMGDFHVRPRLVLISDGKQTDLTDFDSEILPEVETHEVLYLIHIWVFSILFLGVFFRRKVAFVVLHKSLNAMHK